ncbi:serine/threonine protein kinase [Actinomadura barringtoniae]|uniref:Serine/threonine protein kinase n=1 Tax=Actinomadura barringtoniae TaxID=1427535 RepID=A0A939PJX2_9ACTN|nr:serine/threonine-protein kinase [Actinomadura barringtoniae]MBO2451458.1 serine/threonine protein kinase [Actinomadura barringtoniae]
MEALLATDPSEVGPYRLEGRLGIGGQGTVYLGRSGTQKVAVKVLHPHLIAHAEARARFLAEVEVAKQVVPFCTAQVLDSGVADEQPYLVSEFVDGPSLHASVKKSGPRGSAALQRLAINTAVALAGIHQAGVVHRDFKPGNVLLGPDGPVVIDFGIAKALDESRSFGTSQPVGTPAYMAPEQFSREDISPAADLFAWAATMVYAATGKRAFGGKSESAIMHGILHDEPDLDALEEPLRSVVRDCLAKNPAERPAAAEVVERLRGSSAEPAVVVAEKTTSLRRRGGLLAAGFLALVVGIGYAIGTSGDEGGHSASAQSPSPSGTTSSAVQTTSSPGHPSAPKGDQNSSSPASGANPVESPSGGSEPKHKPSPKASGGGSKPASRTKTLGTFTFFDVNNYCRANGYQQVMEESDHYSCINADQRTTRVDNSSVCRWKYPGHSGTYADGETCKSR